MRQRGFAPPHNGRSLQRRRVLTAYQYPHHAGHSQPLLGSSIPSLGEVSSRGQYEKCRDFGGAAVGSTSRVRRLADSLDLPLDGTRRRRNLLEAVGVAEGNDVLDVAGFVRNFDLLAVEQLTLRNCSERTSRAPSSASACAAARSTNSWPSRSRVRFSPSRIFRKYLVIWGRMPGV